MSAVVIVSKSHLDYLSAIERENDNLRAEHAELIEAISVFCDVCKWGADTWKAQAHIKPLFDIHAKAKEEV